MQIHGWLSKFRKTRAFAHFVFLPCLMPPGFIFEPPETIFNPKSRLLAPKSAYLSWLSIPKAPRRAHLVSSFRFPHRTRRLRLLSDNLTSLCYRYLPPPLKNISPTIVTGFVESSFLPAPHFPHHFLTLLLRVRIWSHQTSCVVSVIIPCYQYQILM